MYRDSSMHIKSVNALTDYFEPNYLTSHFFDMNISIQKVGGGGEGVIPLTFLLGVCLLFAGRRKTTTIIFQIISSMFDNHS